MNSFVFFINIHFRGILLKIICLIWVHSKHVLHLHNSQDNLLMCILHQTLHNTNMHVKQLIINSTYLVGYKSVKEAYLKLLSPNKLFFLKHGTIMNVHLNNKNILLQSIMSDWEIFIQEDNGHVLWDIACSNNLGSLRKCLRRQVSPCGTKYRCQ